MTDDITDGAETEDAQLEMQLRRVRIERGIRRGLDVVKLTGYAIIIGMLMAVAAPVLYFIVRGAK